MTLNISNPEPNYKLNSQKRLYLRGKGYSVGILDHNKAVAERQKALKLANLHNWVGPIFTPLSGKRNRNRLKVLMFLINTSSHYCNRISHRRIAYALGIDRRTSIRIVKYLLEYGYITKILESQKINRMKFIANMYVISDIFKDATLMVQLKNMYYETKDIKKPISPDNTEEKFGVTHIRYKRKIINNKSFSTTKTNKDKSSLVLDCLFNVGCDYEEFVSRRKEPERGVITSQNESKLSGKPRSNATKSNVSTEAKTSPKNDMLSYLEQFKTSMVK